MTDPTDTILLEHEYDIIYQMAEALTQARTENEILEAVAEHARHTGALDFGLMHINFDSRGQPYEVVFSASIGPHSDPIVVGRAIPVQQLPYFLFDKDHLDRPLVFEDFASDARITAIARDNADATGIRSGIILPLVSAGELQGALSILWRESRQFSERELYIYRHISPIAASVFASLRAYRIEQAARSDVEMLYRASEAVNAATNFQAVLEAVEPLTPDVDRLFLFLWDELDYRHANHFDLVAAIRRNGIGGASVGSRFYVEQFPIARRAAAMRQLVIENIDTHPDVDPVTRAAWQAAKARALLLVTLVQDERWYGTLSFESQDARPFSERDRRLTLAITDLVTSAVVRIASQLETKQAEEEAAFLYQFAQEVNSATSTQEVADAVLRAYSTVEGVYIQIWEHLDYHRASHYVIAGAAARGDALVADRGAIYPKSDLPDFYERVRQEGIWIVEDADNDPRIDPWLRQIYASINVRATLVLPMLQGERWLASISFRYSKPYRYSARDLRLMRGIRDVVFAAVERIESQEAMRRAYLAEQDARAESEALYRVSEDINAATTFHDIVRAVAKLDFGPGDIYLNLFENYNYEGARYFDIVATANDAFNHEGERWWISEFSLVHKFSRQGVYINENIPENPNIDDASKQQFLRLGVKSNMRVSLSLHGRWMGGLGLDSALPRSYSEREKRLMAGVGDLVAAAVERIRLQQETERAHHRAQELVALEERNRLARELHDSVSQALYGIGLGARTAQAMWETEQTLVKESIDYVLALTEAALVEMRALIFELRPESLENEGLVTVLAKQAASLQTRHGLQVELELCDEPALPFEFKENLFRIAREALHNITKHAGATRVTLRLKMVDGRLLLQIIDDGAGFDINQDFPGHLGLRSMRERIQQLGGQLELWSAVGQGTRLTVTLG